MNSTLNVKQDDLLVMMRNELSSAQRAWEAVPTRLGLTAMASLFGATAAVNFDRLERVHAVVNPVFSQYAGHAATAIGVGLTALVAREAYLAVNAYRQHKEAGSIKEAGDVPAGVKEELIKTIAAEHGQLFRTAAQLTPEQSKTLSQSSILPKLDPMDRLALYLTQDNPPMTPSYAQVALDECGFDSKVLSQELAKGKGIDKGNDRLLKAIEESYCEQSIAFNSRPDRVSKNNEPGKSRSHVNGFLGEMTDRAEKTIGLIQALTSKPLPGLSVVNNQHLDQKQSKGNWFDRNF